MHKLNEYTEVMNALNLVVIKFNCLKSILNLCLGGLATGKRKRFLTAHFVIIEKFTEIYSNNINNDNMIEYTHKVLRTPFLSLHNSHLTR